MNTQQPGQRIAVVGSGISGLTAAYLLRRQHQVTLFEANDYLGGHTHTVPVDLDGHRLWVDTGFIVCNDRTYPNFLKLLDHLGVPLQPTEMSFSVTNPQIDLEYNGHNLDTLFAQRRNLVRPRFLIFVRDILRFNAAAKSSALAEDERLNQTLDDFVSNLGLSAWFRDNYLLPMVAAIWSCSVRQAGEFPLGFFLKFFLNHGLLDIQNRPQWYVLKGGSHAYISHLREPLGSSIRTNSPVERVRRTPTEIQLHIAGQWHDFDQVVMACHSDQALAALETPTPEEQQVLGQIGYQANSVILHSDLRMMPRRRKAWASWNFLTADPDQDRLPRVTYCMNILQSLDCDRPLLVSLNSDDLIDEKHIVGRYQYAHPVYSLASRQAQQQRALICGTDRIHFCGAYWYNGFHEDGVRSALDVCNRFGIHL